MAPPKTPTKQPNPNALRLSAVGRAVQPKRAAPSGSTGLSPQEKRASRGGDVPEHVKRSAVAEYRVALAGASRLPAGALGRVLNKFRDYNVSRTSLLRWVADHRKSLEASGPVEAVAALKSKRAGRYATTQEATEGRIMVTTRRLHTETSHNRPSEVAEGSNRSKSPLGSPKWVTWGDFRCSRSRHPRCSWACEHLRHDHEGGRTKFGAQRWPGTPCIPCPLIRRHSAASHQTDLKQNLVSEPK